MTLPTEICVSTERIDAGSWQELAGRMLASAGWLDDALVFVYTESLDDCKLERCEARKVLERVIECARSEVASLFEGRIFDSRVEARWRRLKDGKWAAWIVRELDGTPEAANDSSSGCLAKARRTLRRYYLLGTRDETVNRFHESRCSSDRSIAGTGTRDETVNRFHEARYAKCFEYPVQDAGSNDRAYIEVAEYRRVEPEWSDLSATGDAGINDINNTLAQPLLFAHRFVRVGAGTTGRKEG